MTRKEKKLISIAGIIFAIFMLAKVIPFVKNYYQKQLSAIEEIKLKKQRFEKLERRTIFWEEEYKNLRKARKKIYKASLSGDTPELISANIQSILKNQARNAGIQFKSMELGESAIVGEWVLVTQAMRFEANSESFFNFLNALDKSKAELIITDLDIRSHRNKIMGKIKVSGFSHPPLKEVKPKKEIPPPVEEIVKESGVSDIQEAETIESDVPENVEDPMLPHQELETPEVPEPEITPESEVLESMEQLSPSDEIENATETVPVQP